MTRRTIVVLEILDDQPDREWYEALKLPAPERWNLADELGESWEGVMSSSDASVKCQMERTWTT